MEAIQRAMDEENKRVGTAQSRQSRKREEEERPKGIVLLRITVLSKALFVLLLRDSTSQFNPGYFVQNYINLYYI